MRCTSCLVILAILVSSAPAKEANEPPPWKTNVPIVSIKKELYKKHPKEGAAALVWADYVGPKLERIETHGLEIRDDVHSQRTRRFSTDNGRTWSAFEPLPEPDTDVYYKGKEVWEGAGPQLFDPASGVLVNMWLRQIAVEGRYNQATYWRISRDYGRTWSAPRQLRYEEGDAFDPEAPHNPSFLHRNQAYFGNNILRHSNGTLIHCVAHANAPRDPENDRRSWRLGSLCFIGRWNVQENDYQWTAGKRVEIPPELSGRGLMEPEVAELTGGRVLVIWRGSNEFWPDGKKVDAPGRKWFSVSTDGGMTLSDPAELKYDDGSSFYSPSSIHRMIRHSQTGKLYWIGNISPVPPRGNWPRYPLVIAEVDEKIPALKKKTVTAIDDRQPHQTEQIQFSNFSLVEDRETHALEMHLTCYGEFPGIVYTADNYKYTLAMLPDKQPGESATSGRAHKPLPIAAFDDGPKIIKLDDESLMAIFLRTVDGASEAISRLSRDNGATWSEPSTLLNLPQLAGEWYPPEALADRHGEVHLFFLQGFGPRRIDIWHARSSGDRSQWSPARRVWEGYTGSLNSVVQLKTGRILLPFSVLTTRSWRNRGEGLDAFTFTGEYDCTLIHSDDDGATWQPSPARLRVPTPDLQGAYGAVEPVVLELRDGRVWMLLRTQLGRFYESFSQDGSVWSDPRPTNLTSSDSPAGLVRLADGRIVLLWNNCLRFPYAYGGRHVLHAAISADEGRTWRGYREVVHDPRNHEPPPPAGDHGTAYPFPSLAGDGKVIFRTGQGRGRVLTMRLDPAWLEETAQRDDFSNGLDGWSVFGTKGVELIDHPDKSAAKALRIRKTDAGWPAAAVWNFPSGATGRMKLKLMIEPGFGGAAVRLADHFSVPFDTEDEFHSLFNFEIAANGRLKPGRWHTLDLAWDINARVCHISLDGREVATAPLLHQSPGACYLRLVSTAEKPVEGGLVIESVEVDVSRSDQ